MTIDQTASPRTRMPQSFQCPKRSISLMYSSARLTPPVKPTFPSMIMSLRWSRLLSLPESTGIKGLNTCALNAHLAQLFAVAHRKAGDAAEIVVHHAHVDALHRLAAQHVQDRVPHLAVIDDEKFEKNIVLRLFQLLQHARKAALAARKIDRLRVVINRITRAGKQVARMVPRRNICFFQRLHHALVLAADAGQP